MSYPATPQQQQALLAQMQQGKQAPHQHQLAHAQAQYAQMQAHARGNPQLQQQLHAQQLRAMQQAQQQQQHQHQQGVAPPPAAPAQAAPPPGITSRERQVGDGDDHLRNAKRRKPTDRSLPSSFAPSLPASVTPGPSDTLLAPSLEALDKLGAAYRRLQDIERKVDWTVSRKAVEVAEKAGGAGPRGEPFRRTLRIHVTAMAHDQPWQLTADELAQAGDKDAVPAGDAKAEDAAAAATEGANGANKVRVPRVELRVTGEVLDDERYPAASTPFTTFLSRLVLETPTRDPAVLPVGSQPLSWTRAASTPAASLPAALTSSHPLSGSGGGGGGDNVTTLDVKLALYVVHPAGERYALHPELAHVLDTAEADRVGCLEALWSYAKCNGLVVEGAEGAAAQQPGAPKSGIKPDERLKRFFGNVPLVQFHHLPEYLNRLLVAPPPRQFSLSIPLSAATSSSPQHFAFDTPLWVPSPVQPALDSAARRLAALASASAPGDSPAAELVALDDKLALNALAARQHTQQLHALAAFARDPRGFLDRFVESQAGALADVLASSGSGAAGGATALGGGSEKVLGARWRDEVRDAANWDAPWVSEAVEVWALRDAEGKAQRLRAQQQQQALAAAQAGYGRR